MTGKGEAKVIVCPAGIVKFIMLKPEDKFTLVIASLNDPTPTSEVFVTVNIPALAPVLKQVSNMGIKNTRNARKKEDCLFMLISLDERWKYKIV